MTTQAQREANKRLQAKKDRIVVWLNKDGTKEQIKAHAESLGMSLNAFITEAIQEKMNKPSE